MYFSQDTIEEIKSRAYIYDVVSDFSEIKLQKSGARYVAKSPFNPDEKTPSFYLTPSKNIFHCFSTGIGGDSITFLMEHKKFDFPNALKYLAEKYHVEIKHHTPTEEEKKEYEEKEELYKINLAALRTWHGELLGSGLREHYNKTGLIDWDGHGYWFSNPLPEIQNSKHFEGNPIFKELLYKRRLSLDTIIQFKIGYAPDSWKFLYEKCKAAGIVALAEKLGVIKKNKSGGYYDAFRHRIIYPIFDHQNRLVGFTGRALEEVVTDKGTKYAELINGERYYDKQGDVVLVAKTINSSDSAIYKKDEILYGLNIAQDAIRKRGFAYICEGANDVISMHQMAASNTVGTLGTALTKNHLRLLSRYTKNICLLYDGDDAGRKASMKAADMAIREGFGVNITLLPKDEDPDSFSRKFSDTGDFSVALLNKTKHAVFQIALIRSDETHDPIAKENLSQELANLIAYVDGETIKDDLIKKISKAYDITTNAFRGMVATNVERLAVKEERRKIIAKKNEIVRLDSDPSSFEFFEEKTDDKGRFKGIKINKMRLVQLLKSFGFSQFKLNEDSQSNFVQIADNHIKVVDTAFIMQHFFRFIESDYDFDTTCEFVHAEMLMNKFLDSPRSYFNDHMYSLVQSPSPIIIHKDTKESTFFYYRNGFVEINAEGWKLHPYSEMEGGIWERQSNEREFKMLDWDKDFMGDKIPKCEAGTFSNFVWLIAGADPERFYALCSIIGYTVHDYYQTDLKAISITDSSLAAESDGRSGKTLLFKMLQYVRKVVDINGKNFNHDDEKRYSQVDIDTQCVALNDIQNRGRNKFSFENMFNDITEGAMVKKLYMNPFRKFMKYWILTNAPLEISGGSSEDRIIEFELSQHFSKNHKPKDEYGIWFGTDYDAKEWAYYDNFMCFCAHLYHQEGIMRPKSINLNERKLKNETPAYFLDFMKECDDCLKATGFPWKDFKGSLVSIVDELSLEAQQKGLEAIKIDKNKWYQRLTEQFPEANNKFYTQHAFTKNLKAYAKYHYNIESPFENRSNNVSWFMFQTKEVKK